MSTLRSNPGAILTEVSSFLINHEDLKLKLNCLLDKKKSLIENIDNLMEAAQTNFQETPDELKHILDQGEATKSKILSLHLIDQDVPRKTRKCRHFNRGFCKFRNTCHFYHNPDICDEYLKNKVCHGRDCPYRHPKPCRNVKRGEKCNWGQNCLYLHSISNETSQCEENATANKIPYSCDICETTFEAASDLNSHIYAKHGNSESNRNSRKGRVDQLLNCDQCSFVSDNNNDLLLHQDSNHDSAALMSTTIYTCDICDVSYNCNCELSDHPDMHRIYSCEQCEFMSFGQYLMQDHMSSSHLHM